jgi:hypothetical protein
LISAVPENLAKVLRSYSIKLVRANQDLRLFSTKLVRANQEILSGRKDSRKLFFDPIKKFSGQFCNIKSWAWKQKFG